MDLPGTSGHLDPVLDAAGCLIERLARPEPAPERRRVVPFMTLAEVGRELNLTRESIRLIERSALHKIRAAATAILEHPPSDWSDLVQAFRSPPPPHVVIDAARRARPGRRERQAPPAPRAPQRAPSPPVDRKPGPFPVEDRDV